MSYINNWRVHNCQLNQLVSNTLQFVNEDFDSVDLSESPRSDVDDIYNGIGSRISDCYYSSISVDISDIIDQGWVSVSSKKTLSEELALWASHNKCTRASVDNFCKFSSIMVTMILFTKLRVNVV